MNRQWLPDTTVTIGMVGEDEDLEAGRPVPEDVED